MPPRPSAYPDLQPRALRELLGVVRAVAAAPLNVALHQVAAEWLDTNIPPERIALRYWQRMPGWFTKTWRRTHPPVWHSPWVGNARFVDLELERELGDLLDHWGVVYVRGVAVLVSEPYLAIPDDPAELRAGLLSKLADVGRWSGGVGLYSLVSSLGPPLAARLMWFPHPDRLAVAMRGRGNQTYGR